MAFEDILKKYFDKVYTEVDFVRKTYDALKKLGFNDDNTIAATCICRDEIAQSLRSIIKHIWGGEAFNLSSLAGMFFAGKTGLLAAMHHAPVVDGKERYVFYALPHIAINEDGRIGICKRAGREGESTACGALNAFQKELKNPLVLPLLKGGEWGWDMGDIEYSLIKIRLSKKIPFNKVPDLLELTRIAQTAIHADIENTLKAVVNTAKSDYALITSIQIHGPEGNFITPFSSYAIVNGKRKDVVF